MPKGFMTAFKRLSTLLSRTPSFEESTKVISAVSPSFRAKLQNWDFRVRKRRIKSAIPSYDTRILPCGVRFHKKYTMTSLPENEKYLWSRKNAPVQKSRKDRSYGALRPAQPTSESPLTLPDGPPPEAFPPRTPHRRRPKPTGSPFPREGWARPHKFPGR